MDRNAAFDRQTSLRKRFFGKPLVHVSADPERVAALLDCNVDQVRLQRLVFGNAPPVSMEVELREIEALLSEIEGYFDRDRQERLVNRIQEDVTQAIAGPLGVSKFIAAYDKVGGNVDTIHNAREGVYATEREKAAYENRGDYDSDAVHSHPDYVAENKRQSINRKTVGLMDAYTGKTLTAHDDVDLDHVVSGKQTHDDPGRVLAEVATGDAANMQENLVATDRSINHSKNAKDTEEFAAYLEETAPQRQTRIAELSARNDLSDKERKELNKLKKLEQADPEAIRERGKTAHAAQDRTYNKTYYTSRKFLNDTLNTSALEGTRMGSQQVLGIILTELFEGIFEEIRLAFRHGLGGEALFKALRRRLRSVANAVAGRWKDIALGFAGGFLSGFLSNVVTVVINALITTGKRVVRMIREGVFSLLRALKLVLFPPPGTSFREALHEASKLVAAGGIVIAGVALEEIVEKQLLAIPFLAPFASVLTVILVGSVSAVGMALTAYLIDRMDLFGVIKAQRDSYVLNELDRKISSQLADCRRMADQIEAAATAIQRY